MTAQKPIGIAVALDGAGWHPAAWREARIGPQTLFTGDYWSRLVQPLEASGADLVTFEDAVGLQTRGFAPVDPADTGRVAGRLDASLLAAWLAPQTSAIGLVPTITTTHTEPFHTATNIASLDHASRGRAGWRVQASPRSHEAAHFGRRELPALSVEDVASGRADAFVRELFTEAGDAIEVARLLWDSWQDDTVIRDVATGRFIDRDRLHRAAFEGERFSVLGPSITPRPPQGQPPVFVLAHQQVPYELAARGADIVFVTPHDDADLARIAAAVRQAEETEGRDGRPLQLWADLVVGLGETEALAAARLADLDALDGEAFTSDALVVTGTAASLVERLQAWSAAGVDGFRLRPLTAELDAAAIAADVLPRLAASGALDRPDADGTLRTRLGLGRAENRFTGTPPFTSRGGAAAIDQKGRVA